MSAPMTIKDWEYIEARLLAPSTPVGDAYVRLNRLGLYEDAKEILDAQKVLQDVCRTVRLRLQERMRERR